MERKLSLVEAKDIIKYVIVNNRLIQETGRVPKALELESPPGIGKTSLVTDLAKELGMDMVCLNLAQLDELGDLVGLPLKEYEFCNEVGDCVWVPEKTVSYYQNMPGYHFNNATRTSYSKPFWLKEEHPNGLILCLDDYTRAAPKFQQSCMELINKQEYYSWKLPPNSHIILTTNPDDGNFSVFGMDSAQKTRFLSFKIRFDVDAWVKWAVNARVDERCVAFVQHNHNNLFPQYYGNVKDGATHPVNPRVANTFFDCLQGIKDYSKELEMVTTLGQATIGEATHLFLQFVAQGLDKIFTSEQLLDEKFEAVAANLKEYVKDIKDKGYRTDIAAIVADRVFNELMYRYETKGEKVKGTHRKRMLEILNSDFFSVDIKNKIVNSLFTNFKLNAFINEEMAVELHKFVR